jgi:hypothetical protein
MLLGNMLRDLAGERGVMCNYVIGHEVVVAINRDVESLPRTRTEPRARLLI